MKKLFFAICFSILAFNAKADVKEFMDVNTAKSYQKRNEIKPISPQDKTIYFDTKEQIAEFLEQRLRQAVKSQMDEDGEIENMRTMDIQNSSEYVETQRQNNKPTFQRIYEEALKKSGDEDNDQRRIAPQSSVEKARAMAQQQAVLDPTFPTIRVKLPPFGKETLVPAAEHIPYFYADISVLPTGMLNIDETVTIVANGQKLKEGLVRAIPKYSTSRAGERNKIDLTILSVMINDTPIEYKAIETAEYIMLVPKVKRNLAPGVYTYNINYTVDRRLWYYDDFNELYWDATGSNWNLVIARAGATVSLPEGRGFIGHSFFIGFPQDLRNLLALTFQDEDNALGFIAARPLYTGEGMFIITSFGKEGFIAPDLSRRFIWFVNDYGSGMFALFGLLAIAIAYYFSWKDMQKKNSGTAANMRQNSPMLRYLLKGVFDKVSFGSFLLEMFKRNIIDIKRDGNDIVLVRKSDNTKGLGRPAVKALNNLFINKESVLKVNANNALKIKRAYQLIEGDIKGRFKNFTIKLNLGYLVSSCLMMLIAFVGIAFIQVEFWASVFILISNSVVMATAIYLLKKSPKNKTVKHAFRIASVLAIVGSFFMLAVFFGGFTALMIMLMIITIFVYTKLFATKDGLVRANIVKAEEYQNFIKNNVETISLGRDFMAQQSSIFALDMSDMFSNNDNIKEYYKLDIMKDIIKRM